MRKPLFETMRPTSLENYIFQTAEHERFANKIVNTGELPNVMLQGKRGTGKTTLARILVNACDIHPDDILEIDGSANRSVASGVEKRISDHIDMTAMGKMKVIIIEECDMLTPHIQESLRVSSEQYPDRVRFVCTCNYAERLDSAFLSRFGPPLAFEPHSDEEAVFTYLIGELGELGLITEENVEEDAEVLMKHISAHSGDMRMIIQSIDQSTDYDTMRIGNPIAFASFGADITEWEQAWHDRDKERILEAIRCVDEQNYVEVYTIIHQNLDMFGADKAESVICLAKYLDMAQRTENQLLTLDACVNDLFFGG